MSKHAIVIIKNNNNEYLQYYDNRWNSYLFMNCKLNDDFTNKTIIEFISEKLQIEKNNILCEYIGEKTHKKFSESAQKIKEYEHFFYKITISSFTDNMLDKTFYLDDIKYTWYSYEELLSDERIMKVNSDIVGYVKELKL